MSLFRESAAATDKKKKEVASAKKYTRTAQITSSVRKTENADKYDLGKWIKRANTYKVNYCLYYAIFKIAKLTIKWPLPTCCRLISMYKRLF